MKATSKSIPIMTKLSKQKNLKLVKGMMKLWKNSSRGETLTYEPLIRKCKFRLKKKKERRLDVYRRRNTEETIVEARKRYHERRLERKISGRPI